MDKQMKLKTGGTLEIDWILAVSPNEITAAQLQTSTMAHAQVTCNKERVQHIPGVLKFIGTPKSTPQSVP